MIKFFLEINIRGHLYNLRLGKDFLHRTKKENITKIFINSTISKSKPQSERRYLQHSYLKKRGLQNI